VSGLISLINKIPFGTPAERGFFLYSRLSDRLIQKIEADNFRKTVQFVYEHSQFYKKKFDERSIDPHKIKLPEDLGDFFTTPEDIRSYIY